MLQDLRESGRRQLGADFPALAETRCPILTFDSVLLNSEMSDVMSKMLVIVTNISLHIR